jgi:alkylhydroperoxidase family enzyme
LLQREASEQADGELAEGWGENFVAEVLRDLESSPLPEREKALLRFVDRVNQDSQRITAADMQPLYEAGWTDEAVYYAITVCALFNFYNRWIDASGVHALSDETHRQGGVRSANAGYVRK